MAARERCRSVPQSGYSARSRGVSGRWAPGWSTIMVAGDRADWWAGGARHLSILDCHLDGSPRLWCELSRREAGARRRGGCLHGGGSDVAVETRRLQAAINPRRLPPRARGDLLCRLEINSSDELPRTALLCAPLSTRRGPSRRARIHIPLRSRGRVWRLTDDGAALLRAARRRGATRSTSRCCALLSETDNIENQGATWLVGGKVLSVPTVSRRRPSLGRLPPPGLTLISSVPLPPLHCAGRCSTRPRPRWSTRACTSQPEGPITHGSPAVGVRFRGHGLRQPCPPLSHKAKELTEKTIISSIHHNRSPSTRWRKRDRRRSSGRGGRRGRWQPQ